MADYQTFPTRCEAEAEIATMRGWEAHTAQLYLPDDPDANDAGDAWVIEIRVRGDPLYLRTDGYVR